MDNQQPCIWATNRDHWDSFLNDPKLADAIDHARRHARDEGDVASAAQTGTTPVADKPSRAADDKSSDDGSEELSIGARLRAYETPITDEILRQSIR